MQESEIVFQRDDVGPVLEAMNRLAQRGDGQGWLNVRPTLTAEQALAIPGRSGLAAWFSGRGPELPLATWTPAARQPRHRSGQVGVAHGGGPNGLDQLAARGVAPSDGWVKRQDHAKHGIVFDLPVDADLAAVVAWMVDAVAGFCVVIEPGPDWLATVYEPTR